MLLTLQKFPYGTSILPQRIDGTPSPNGLYYNRFIDPYIRQYFSTSVYNFDNILEAFNTLTGTFTGSQRTGLLYYSDPSTPRFTAAGSNAGSPAPFTPPFDDTFNMLGNTLLLVHPWDGSGKNSPMFPTTSTFIDTSGSGFFDMVCIAVNNDGFNPNTNTGGSVRPLSPTDVYNFLNQYQADHGLPAFVPTPASINAMNRTGIFGGASMGVVGADPTVVKRYYDQYKAKKILKTYFMQSSGSVDPQTNKTIVYCSSKPSI
jgi:hypothetical protein